MISPIFVVGLARLLVVLDTSSLAASFTFNVRKPRNSLASATDSYGVAFDILQTAAPPVEPISPSVTSAPSPPLTSGPRTERNELPLTTFRDAEVIGLNLMQLGEYEEALKTFEMGMKLKGSRIDIVRTKNIQGPSPVGGSHGGTEGRTVCYLDEFEKQAGHYNMACAHARLGNAKMSIENLRAAVTNGFDNIATIESDPDLRNVREAPDFQVFLAETQKELNKRKGLFRWFS